MPYLNDYIIELKLGKDAELESIFNLALKEVFSAEYLSKIDSTIKKRVKVKEKINHRTNVVAWVEGTTIYVNKPQFYARDKASQIKYLLHEFMHVLMNSKSFFVINKFKEVKNLSELLWTIIKKHTDDPGKFLTGTSQKKSMLNSQEALSYLMNDKIKWSAMSPVGIRFFKKTISDSKLFNTGSRFWKSRLS
jgi:hypothetical protein